MKKQLLFILIATMWSISMFFQTVAGVPKAERDALLALYNATDGSNWNQNTNWNTENDVAQWYGVTVESGYVTALNLGWNQLTGTIPAEIGGLTNLRVLSLYGNQLTGSIPTEIGQMINLTGISLRNNQLTGAIPSELSNLINLESLNLDNNQLSGNIPSELGNLTKLYRLDLKNNQLTGSIPLQLNELSHLRYLYLSNNQLSSIEGELSNLTNVYSLNLEGNKLTFADLETANINISSYSPQNFIYNNQVEDGDNIILTAPESAGGESFQWYKNNVKVDEETNQQITVAKTEADAYFCKVTHSKFPDLTLHSINANQIIGGVFKFDRDALLALYNATDGPNWNQNRNWNTESDVAQWYGVTVVSGYVTALNLGWNQLSGTIPAEIGGLTNLRVLSLYGNQLTGSIPTEIGQMINLESLDLDNNQLSGNIPSELGNLTKLYSLDLRNNQLTGTIPAEIGQMINLESLNLDNNQLSGNIPSELGNLTNLYTLDLKNNQLTGSIPSQLNELTHLQYINLSNNHLSSIEGNLSNLTNVYSLNLAGNKLTFADLETANVNISSYSPQNFIYNNQVEDGENIILTIPELAGGENFQWYKNNVKVDEETNQQITVAKTEADAYFCKVTHSKFPDLTLHSINANQIIGGVFKFDRDALLALYNATDGPNWNQNTNWNTESDVAQWYGVTVESGYVTALNLDWNQLTGTIPAEIGGLTNLRVLSLYGNQLTGSIPTEIGQMINLESLDLDNNQLSGNIPSELGNLTKLYSLDLRNNQLTGTIPAEIGQMINLTGIILRNNQLTGAIPSQLNELTHLQYINLSNNQLSSIEGELSNLTNVYSLNLEGNKLTFADLETANIYISSYSPQDFIYNNQVEDGENIILTAPESAGGESFQWYKNNVKVDEETNQQITVAKTDADAYFCKVTHSKFPDLTLHSINANQIIGGVFKFDRDALLALYNATDGPNWNQNTNWNTESDVAQWYGVTVESGYVTALNLDWNQLTGTIPAEIGGLTNLRVLSLYDNQLTGSIPTEIGQMINLTGISLRNNQLTGAIPSELSNLINLESLNLDNNQLSGTIPAEIGGLKNLRELYLNRNQLTGIIPNEVGELINLNYLDLSNNQLEGAIPSELSELINIWWINLTNNQFSKIEGDLSSLTNIYSFNLAENRLTFTDLEKANIKINSYSPQAMLGITLTEDVNNITLFTSESDGGESYQWYKDEEILDGSTSKELTVAKTNLGIYHCKITHSKFPSLTLRTEDAEVHTYMLAYTAGANGTISGNTIQVVNKGNNATAVEAVPNQNYHFVEWSDGIKTAKRTDSYITQNLLVEATFSINPYLVTFFVKGSNGTAIFNATITIDGKEITTDEEGKVSIKLLGGNYTYVASLDGRQIESEEIDIIEGNVVVNIIDLFTGVKADYRFNMEISPNPFTDQLTIRKATNVVRVEITDLTGKRLFSQNYSGETDILINSSAFDRGFYLVSIYTSYGIKTVEKVMKK